MFFLTLVPQHSANWTLVHTLNSHATANGIHVHLVTTQRVEAEASNITGNVEPGLLQISATYSFTAMAESLHVVASKRDVPGHRTFCF
jgi:hypothetical protein